MAYQQFSNQDLLELRRKIAALKKQIRERGAEIAKLQKQITSLEQVAKAALIKQNQALAKASISQKLQLSAQLAVLEDETSQLEDDYRKLLAKSYRNDTGKSTKISQIFNDVEPQTAEHKYCQPLDEVNNPIEQEVAEELARLQTELSYQNSYQQPSPFQESGPQDITRADS